MGSDFNPHKNIIEIDASSWKSELEIQNYVSNSLAKPFNTDLPAWEFHLLQNFHEKTVIYGKFDHATGDGFTIVQILLALTDKINPENRKESLQSAVGKQQSNATALHECWRWLLSKIISSFWLLWYTPLVLFLGCIRPFWGDTFSQLAPYGHEKGEISAYFSCSFSVQDLKRIGSKHNAKINDVLLSMLAFAHCKYLKEICKNDVGKHFRASAACTINFRKTNLLDKPNEENFGNRSGFIFLPLPGFHQASDDVHQTLQGIKKITDKIKASPYFVFQSFSAWITRTLPSILGFKPLVEFLSSERYGPLFKTVFLTNVPGPREKITLLGVSVESIRAIVNACNVACAFSYAGQLYIGYSAHKKRVDGQQVVSYIQEAFQRLSLEVPDKPSIVNTERAK